LKTKEAITSWGRPFQPPKPVPPTLEIRFEEAIGLGLLCRSLSKSPNPWLDIIPDTRKISTHKKSIYLRERSRVILKWNITKWRIEAIRKRKEGNQKKSWNTKQKWRRRRRRRPKWMHHISCISDTMIIPWKLLVEKFKKKYTSNQKGGQQKTAIHTFQVPVTISSTESLQTIYEFLRKNLKALKFAKHRSCTQFNVWHKLV